MDILEVLEEKGTGKAIVFQSVADLAIDELKRDYLPLSVSGVDDKEGCKVVNEARKHVKKIRTGLEAERKKLKAASLEYGRKLDAEAKRLMAPLVEIESHLAVQEKIVTDEFARKKAEEQKAIEDKHKQRIVDLIEAGAVFDGTNYVWNKTGYSSQELSDTDIWNLEDEKFKFMLRDIRTWKIQEDEKKAEDERLAKIEADKIKKHNDEIERKNKEAQDKIDAENQKLAEREAKIKADEQKIADEKAEQQRLKDVEAQKIKDEEAAKKHAEQQKIAKIEREKKAEALKPDKEKIYDYLNKIKEIKYPVLENEESKGLMMEFHHLMNNYLDRFITYVEEL